MQNHYHEKARLLLLLGVLASLSSLKGGESELLELVSASPQQFRLTANFDIECAPNKRLALSLRESAREGRNPLASNYPEFVNDIERGQILKKRITFESAGSRSYFARVKHINPNANDGVVSYYASKGSGLIVERGKQLTLRDFEPAIFSELCAPFPSAYIKSLIPHINSVVVERKRGIPTFLLSSDSSCVKVILDQNDIARVEVRSLAGDSEELETIIEVKEWMDQDAVPRLPSSVVRTFFGDDGAVIRTEKISLEVSTDYPIDESKFEYEIKPGFRVFDRASNSYFWTNDVIDGGWERNR